MNKVSKFVRKTYRRLVVGARKPVRIVTEAELERLYHLPNSCCLNKEERKEKIIVSLTSFPSRFARLHLVIRSLLLQSMKPDEVILYLDNDVDIASLPASLTEMEQYGLQIISRPGNLKPHKKYYYAIKEHPEDLIITVDDDMIYPQGMTKELVSVHENFPECVVAARAHRILFDWSGNMEKYNEWEWEYWKEGWPSLRLLATGCAGVLYPPHCMDEKLFDIELIQQMSLNADDLWLKVMQVLKGTKVVLCSQEIRKERRSIAETQEISLMASNVQQNMNDVYLQRLMEYFRLGKKDFE